jgi:hypothetical protein
VPVADNSQLLAPPLTFFRNDGTTPLEDPSSVGASADDDQLGDVITGLPSDLQSLLVSPDSIGEEVRDEFDDGFIEVYGPPSKRQRLSIDNLHASTLNQPTLSQQLRLNSEEMSVSPLANSLHVQPDLVDPLSNHAVENYCATTNSTPFGTAVPATADLTDDGPLNDHIGDPVPRTDVLQVTQDKEDPPPQVLDELAQQLSRVAADSAEDKLFDKISGHDWKTGVLMFQVLWKTDETSCLPFSTVKRDFPVEMAAYVLSNKLGCADGKYTGGRCTRWARQYNRQFKRILRCLIRLETTAGIAAGRSIRVNTHLPNSIPLIRRAIREVPRSAGVRKRKKPGRISRPFEVKYCVPIPRSIVHALELDAEAGNTFWADAI